MNHERQFRLQMTVRDRDLQTIFDLLHDVARDFKMIELHHGKPNGSSDPAPTSSSYEEYRERNRGKWAYKLWPDVEAIFRQQKKDGDGMVRYDDPRLIQVLVKSGNNPHTITPLLSEFKRQGKLIRPHRGWYMLP